MNHINTSSAGLLTQGEAAFSGTGVSLVEIPSWKRALDLALALAFLPALLPLGLCIAVLVALVSPGPVLFRQERVGFRGRRFMCLKFRTMRVNAGAGVHREHLSERLKSNRRMVKLDRGDARLILFGATLRALGLDELPQLINVLQGEMSIVGPRPCIPYEFEHYLPWHRRRCDTLPGLTGMWQVNGKNRTTFEEMIDFDLYYVAHKSPGLDLTIIARTLPAVLWQAWESRFGATIGR